MENKIKTLTRYLQKESPYLIRFQEKQAKKDQLTREMILAGRYVERFSISYAKFRAPAQAKEGIPIYGNWCEPGHGQGEPIDLLDYLCQQHDWCYQEKGYFHCECDRMLIKEIKNNLHQMKPRERIIGLAICTYFRMAPCIP